MKSRTRFISRTLLLAALLLALVLPGLVAAAGPCTTICYVDGTTGNDANDGDTPATAKLTIQAAVTQVTAGGQVIVAAGTYAEDVTVNKAVTVTGAGPATTIIDPVNYVGISADNVTFEDIAIANSASHGARLSKSGSPLANTTFDNVHFLNNISRGIEIVNLVHVTNLQVLNSLFEGNATGIRMASNATADGITIDNTTFQNQTGSGFNQANDGITGWVKNLTVTDSTFINLGTTSGHAGVYAEEFSNVLIENSTFTGNRYGINLWDAYSVAASVTTNVVIRGNTFTDHEATAIAFRSTTSDPNAQLVLIENNTINQDVSDYVAGSFATIAVTTHSTNANGAVDVVGNNITFSGALPVGTTAMYGIYVLGGMDDVRIEDNTTDGGGIANNGAVVPPSGVRFSTFGMKATAMVLVTRNTLSNFVNGVSVHNGTAFGGVASPNFEVVRNDLSNNSGYGFQSGPTMDSIATCNWWGAADGPGPVGPGSGTNVTVNVDFNPWLTSSDLDDPCVLATYVSARVAGVTDDNLAFGPHDILEWDGVAWSKWFDGTAAGLTPNGRNKHDLAAIWIPDPADPDVVLGFVQNLRKVPGISGKVDGMDLVWWDGSAFSIFFDGQDVGLTVKTHEKIDALHVLDGDLSPVGGSCVNYLLISTQGPGRVPGVGKFGGEDVLGFCQTNVGAATAGVWHLLIDGSAEGMPANSTNGLSFSDDGQTMYLTTHAAFNVDTASGSHSMVYQYDFGSGEFSGPYFVATDVGLHEKVNGLHLDLDAPSG